jgi:hypothetical protein
VCVCVYVDVYVYVCVYRCMSVSVRIFVPYIYVTPMLPWWGEKGRDPPWRDPPVVK